MNGNNQEDVIRVKDYVTVGIFMNGQFKHDKGFNVTLRLSAQKKAIQAVFGSEFEKLDGWESVHQTVLHSLRIKIQSFVKSQMHALTKISVKRNTVEALEVLSEEDIKKIQDLCIDWQYGAKVREDPTVKKALLMAELFESNPSDDLIKEIKADPNGYIESMKAKLMNS